MSLELIQNPDILLSVMSRSNKPFTVGFAAETENLIEHATSKLKAKNLDMIVANNVADKTIGFDSDDNETTVIKTDVTESLPRMSKDALARVLIKIIASAVVEPD